MKNESQIKGMPLREGLKIRHYIMNLIYQHPHESVMIPSSKEFAARFGVARSTVTLVLKDLCDEGYLEGRRGIGTFTRHVNFVPQRNRMVPLIGLLAGDGKYFYYPHQVWSVMARCGSELTGNSFNVRPISLTGATDDDIFNELTHQYLDGLAWLDSSPRRLPLIRRLKNAGIKAMVQLTSRLEDEVVDVDSFSFDFYTAGLDVGRQLLAEKRSHLFFVFENPLTTSLLAGIRAVYDGARESLRVTSFDWSRPGVFAQIEELLPALEPDALYIHDEHFSTMSEILARQQTDTINACRLIAESHAIRIPFYGLVLEIPFEAAGTSMGTRLRELFLNPTSSPIQAKMSLKITMRTGEASL